MSAPDPQVTQGSRTSFLVKVAGKPIASTFGVVSIDTWVAVNKVPKAKIVLFDGSPAKRNFPISNLKTFVPGAEMEIAAGYDGKNTTIFKGVIVKQNIEIDQYQGSKLVVDVTDKALKMTLDRKNAIYEDMTDGDLIGKLISQNGLTKDVASTKAKQEQIVQYYASDWDLMLTRAEVNGLVVSVAAGKVTVKPPDTSQKPALTVTYGDSMLDFSAEMDAATQYASSAIKSASWDASTQKLVESGPATVSVSEPGNMSSAELAKVFNVAKYPQQSGGAVQKPELESWSSGELLKSKLSKIRGYTRFAGSSLVEVGKTIEIAGCGDRFNGKVFVSGVHHGIRDNRWITTVSFGLSALWFAEEARNIAAPGASGLMPPIKGLQTGVVKQIAKDKGGEYRVQLTLPLLQSSNKAVWARLGSFYASNKVGAVFYPEIGDEVVVGFMNEDPRYPVILGSLYSKKLPPAYPPDDKNTKKAIVTQSKLEIFFDETSKAIEIRTPGKQSVRLDDKAGSVTVKDKNGNTVSLSKSGVSVESASNLKLNAKGNITITAGANLSLSAKVNASMEGVQVAHKAKAKFSAQGSTAAEVTSTGMLTVRGTLVKIN